ncbi:hypothetical protein ASG43_02310 [Aureimonas sp. Leaf454]|uniref:SGNH/GDSL hydrolase family protein n=1 Tax=Aureimonas sp. Leaf454 TaxID=1736381 RepID=UPI0006F96276|nr:SGNH family hydrolase [Aureimonas sp. Leaf454]KQT54454.1 hypothetical protein ASG43_02310 [Aureimonas sp. Leaf454]
MTKRSSGGTTTRRRIRLLLVLPLAVVIGAPEVPLLGSVRVAAAQERPRTIMDMLFGSPSIRRRPMREIDPPRRASPKRKAKPRQSKGQSAAKARGVKADRSTTAAVGAGAAVAAGAVGTDDATPVEKKTDAKTVLVVGDFLAASLASGLTDALAGNPFVRIENVADGSSGLVRADHLDWVHKIGPLIAEKKPVVVVVMIGSNDRQPISNGSITLSPGTGEWAGEYARRAESLAKAIEERDVPLVWVGMPSFKYDRMSADMATFNEIYRKASGGVGGEFVDVWDGFVDANGAFSYSGPDISGQQARLRNEDGITMTAEGAEKLAFFAEKPLLRLLGPTASIGPTAPGEIASVQPAVRPANATSAPLVGLNDPALDGGDTLLGGSQPVIASGEPSPRQQLVVSGEPLATPIGRADNFNWSGKTEAVAPLRGTDDVISRGSVELQDLKKQQGLQPPKPMPSLADAIIDDWEAQNAAQGKPSASEAAVPPPAGGGPSGAAPEPSGRATSPGTGPAPSSASPFAADPKPL